MAANKDHVGRSRAYSKNNSPVAGDLDLIFQKQRTKAEVNDDLDLILDLPFRSASGRSEGEKMVYPRKRGKRFYFRSVYHTDNLSH